VLKAMGRRYTTAVYRERVMRAVESIPDCAIGIDVIAGYPGESEEDFQDMYRFIEGLPAAYLHVFTCSVRPGTRLASQTASGERKLSLPADIERRSGMLIELGIRKKSSYTAGFLGKERKVLVETCMRDEGGRVCCSGYTSNYLQVTAAAEGFEGDAGRLKGMLVPVVIGEMDHDLNLQGRLLF